ncbi:unnamed protein product [Durusdinium trenchii]|uniref:Uncharacterized protein n=2 Tax=Durusdinium trenchii TaxID=1381693 RepID=A0ABP0H6Z8_9DINO
MVASSLLQSLFGPGQRCEEQRGVKMENAKCTKAYSVVIEKRRPARAFDLDLSLQEQCSSESPVFGQSPDGKLSTPGSKGRAQVLANFNQRYEVYDRLLR